jgi:hypothetical protein
MIEVLESYIFLKMIRMFLIKKLKLLFIEIYSKYE